MTNDVLPAPRPSRNRCLIGCVLVFALLAGAGAVALNTCPWFHALTSATDNPLTTQKIEALEARVRLLESNLKSENTPTASAPSDTHASLSNLSDSLKTLQEQIAHIQTDRAQDKQDAQKIVTLAFAFWDVRSAANEGRPYSAPLNTLQKYAEHNARLTQPLSVLSTYVSGVKTFAQLRDALTMHEPDTTTTTDTEPSTWQERIKKILGTLISVRPLHNAAFDPLEHALANSDAQGATSAFAALPDDVRKILSPWQEQLNARIAVDTALHDAAATLALPTPEQGNTP